MTITNKRGNKMSMVLKENGGLDREVELPNDMGLIIKTLGIEPTTTREDTIKTINRASIHMATQGKNEAYKRLHAAVEEIQEWSTETLTVEF